MKRDKHITDEEWAAVARNLYERDSVPLPSGEEPETAEPCVVEMARQVDLYFKLKKFDSGKAYLNLKTNKALRPMKSAKSPQIFLRIAAALALAILVASAGFYIGSRKVEARQHAGVTVDQYGNSRIVLPDSSVVTLNHDTKMKYPDQFSGNTREVQIEGEAYFEVKPDPAHPFLIHAGKAEIKVLGTTFSVTADPGSEQVEVVVETGKVQFRKTDTDEDGTKQVILDPGDRGVLSGPAGGLVKCRNDNPNFLSWKTRNFSFERTSLKEVIQQLNKVYQVTVKADEPQLEELLLTARFEGRSLDFILKVIAMTHDLKIEQKDEQYFITGK